MKNQCVHVEIIPPEDILPLMVEAKVDDEGSRPDSQMTTTHEVNMSRVKEPNAYTCH